MSVITAPLLNASNVVINVILYDPQGTFVPPAGLSVGNANTPFAVGWTWNGSTYDAPPEPEPPEVLPPTTQELIDYNTAKRQFFVNGQTTVTTPNSGAIPVWVDSESRGAITGLVVASNIVPDLTTGWKGADGNFYQLNTADIIALALGMMAYVNLCFVAEATTQYGIGAETITTYEQIDAQYASL